MSEEIGFIINWLKDNWIITISLLLSFIAILFTALKDFILPFFIKPKLKITYTDKEPYKRAPIFLNPGSILSAFDRFKVENIGKATAKNCRCQIYQVKDGKGKEEGKAKSGSKEKSFVLASKLIEFLNEYLQNRENESEFLFPTRKSHMSIRMAQKIVNKAAKTAKIEKKVNCTLLRDTYSKHLIENGVDGLFPLSGTGEFPMLSLRESKQFINFVMRSSSGRVPVYPGAFRDNLGDTLELAFAAEISGAEGIVLMPPYFYGRIKSEDIVDQVRRIKCNINLPVIFYNTNSKLRLDEASMLRLHQEGLVIGAKEGSKDLDYLKRLAESGMSVLPGSDKLLYAASQFGCVGGFPGSANVLTKGFVTLWKFIQEEKERVVLKLPPKLAPYQAAVFPLLANKPELVKLARKIYDDLRKDLMVAWDDRGNIGKRYYSQDEIGTPACITVDFDSLKKDDVTIRDRDTMKQERVKIDSLAEIIREKLEK